MKTPRHLPLCLLFLLLPAVSLSGAQPNVLFLFSDDQRWDTIAALGNGQIQTPNLDKLVRSGSTFTRAYCMGSMQGAVCVPSRAMLMTGRSLFRATSTPTSGQIPPEYQTWPQQFREAGYKTIGIGKWHNDRPSFSRSFSDGGPIFFGGMSDQSRIAVYSYNEDGRYPKEDQVVTNVFSSELFANAAVHFLEKQSPGEPFLMYVAFTSPHDPRTPPDDYERMYAPEKMKLPPNFLPEHPFDNGEMKVRDEALLPWPRTEEGVRGEIADYYGMITHLDAQVGRILQTLESRGLADNTIIVFGSDHGLAIGSHGLLGKQNLYEHSTRAALILAGPGIPQGKRFDSLCYLYDLYPTLCELADVHVPESVEGQSLLPVLRGKAPSGRKAIFTAYKDVQRAIRGERWKMITYPQAGRTQVFDLAHDPDEMNNLAGTRRAARVERELRSLLREAQQTLEDPLLDRK